MNLRSIIKTLPNASWIVRNGKPFFGRIMLIVLLTAATSLAGVGIAIVSKNIIDSAIGGDLRRAALFGGFFLGIVVFNLVTHAFLSVFSSKVQEQFSNQMRSTVYSRLVHMEWLEVSRYHSGDLLTRLTSDISSVSSGSVSIAATIIAMGVQLIAAFVTLLHYEPRLALLAFVLAPFTILASRIFGRKLKKLHLKMQETEGSYRSHMQENIQNLLVLKTFGLEDRSLSKAEDLQQERLHWVIERGKTSAAVNTMLAIGYWIGYLMAFGWGAMSLAAGTATYGTMTAFLQLVNQIQGPFIGLSRTVPQIISALASAGRLVELENLATEARGELMPRPISAGIRFSNVSYAYEKDEPVLWDVSFEAYPGQTVALVGPSGEGKTTLIRLMLALIRPDKGNVDCIDSEGMGHAASCGTRDWFSYVPQGNTLFSGTLEENLLSGNPDANTADITEALHAACAMEFVEKLPDGVKTVLGEKAHGLSEGQAQRVAIARALLRQAPIIILDEATSALDMETEERVLHGIRTKRPNCTCIMITHRPSFMKYCKSAYRILEGRLLPVDQFG